ncbi:MAG: Hpt domain-containing protein, partial [Butyrivibrio sp.]|nr:Hpt domain-containing protein [Butyrivibrio sp.]
MDVSQYLGVFLDEAKEHIQSLNDNIMMLEEDPTNEDCINEIFRAAHSMKGMAGTMGYKRMQQLTHDMEDVFSDVRGGVLKVDTNMTDTLFQCLDAVQAYVDKITETQDEGTEDNANLIKALADIRAGKGGSAAPQPDRASRAESVSKDAKDAEVSGASWKTIQLEPNVKSTLETAMEDGKKIYGMTVHIQETCILKAARAFLVFKGLEEAAEIAVSEPSAQDIEDEKFEFTFSLILISDADMDKVADIARNVSEIESVEIGEFDIYNAKLTEDREASAISAQPSAVSVQQEQAGTSATAAPAVAPAASGSKKPVGKPVV